MNFAHSSASQPGSRTDSGFTLVEVLVTAGILVAFASAMVVAVGGIADRSQDTGCAQHRRVVTIAVESYLANHQTVRLPALSSAKGAEFDRGFVSASVIRDASAYYDIAADGSLVPVAGSLCS